MDETKSLTEIRSLFDQIARKHCEPSEYTHRDELRRFLYCDEMERKCRVDVDGDGDSPPGQQLTAEDRDLIQSYIFGWREEHHKLVLENMDKLTDDGLTGVGNEYCDVFECGEVISESKKVYEETWKQCEQRDKCLTSDIQGDVTKCLRSFQALNRLAVQGEQIGAQHWTDSEWIIFCEHVHNVSQHINRMANLVRRKAEFQALIVFECDKAIGELRKSIARVKFAKYDQLEAMELNQRRAIGRGFGKWVSFLSNMVAYSAVLAQNCCNANIADKTEKKLTALSDRLTKLKSTNLAPQLDQIASLIEGVLRPQLDEYFFFDTLKIHILVARQCKLYTELWWIDIQLRISNQDFTEANELLQHESDQLTQKLAALQTRQESIFTETPRQSLTRNEETDSLLGHNHDDQLPVGDVTAISRPTHVEMALIEYEKLWCDFQRELIDAHVAQLIADGPYAPIRLCEIINPSECHSLDSFRTQNDLLLRQISSNIDKCSKLIKPLRRLLSTICDTRKSIVAIDMRARFDRKVNKVVQCWTDMSAIAMRTAIHVDRAKKLFVDYQRLATPEASFPKIVRRSETDLLIGLGTTERGGSGNGNDDSRASGCALM